MLVSTSVNIQLNAIVLLILISLRLADYANSSGQKNCSWY